MIRKNWPVFATAIIFVLTVVWCVLNEDPLGWGIMTYGILLPLCSAVMGVWYGLRWNSWKKWLIPIGTYLIVAFHLIVCTLVVYGKVEVDLSELKMGLFAFVPCLLLMAISSFGKYVKQKVGK